MNITANELVRKASDIGSLPTIYTELDHKINDPMSNLEDVATILLDDAGLSARSQLDSVPLCPTIIFPLSVNTDMEVGADFDKMVIKCFMSAFLMPKYNLKG